MDDCFNLQSMDDFVDVIQEFCRTHVPELKPYKCEYYLGLFPAKSCLFCTHCTDIVFDYTNGPYMFSCDIEEDTSKAFDNSCDYFEFDENINQGEWGFYS